jgi:ABC-type transport system substrate-binding protein
MRFSIQRALSPDLQTGYQGTLQPAQYFLTNLVGEAAFRAGKRSRLSGVTTAGPWTLIIRTTAAVPDLVDRLAMPFFSAEPIGTPVGNVDLQAHPIPSAGPYYIAYQNTGWQTVLKRNPNYHGPRPHRLDAIVYQVGINTGQAASMVERGALDYESESDPDFGVLAPGGEIARRYSSVRQPAGRPWYTNIHFPGMRWLDLNTRHGLLAHVDVRRAVNLAIDRVTLAANDGGIPSDQYLPPPMLGPDASKHVFPIGQPTAADLAHARRLVAGHTGRLVLYTCQSSECVQQGAVIRGDLARIGLRVVIHHVPDVNPPPNGNGPPAGRGDLRLTNWITDEYDPTNVLDGVLFSSGPFHVYPYDSTRWERADHRAGMLSDAQGRWNAFANVALGVERTDVPWAVFEQLGQPAFFSARLGCIRYPPPIGGIDIAALCLRG